ncbi:expressed unknown protein [Seminavis robusta]|uniref:Uncharacterized protein n=1 Tax=Seminavis robusta TaxID=568900 RepID=A0A9N8DIH1_9STRA|nr:expressed unknown protein [Seminavis robusta]|eukprot:Sro170_g075420.1 n/a (76) ;mRNA; r:47706-48043
MRFTCSIVLLALTTSVSAFAPSAFPGSHASTKLYSEPAEGEGLDLNLEEMFEMFDAADKEEDFDDAVDKVKGKED